VVKIIHNQSKEMVVKVNLIYIGIQEQVMYIQFLIMEEYRNGWTIFQQIRWEALNE